MASSGMLRRVALVRTDVSGEPSASFIGVTRIGELGITLPAAINRRRENLKSYNTILLHLVTITIVDGKTIYRSPHSVVLLWSFPHCLRSHQQNLLRQPQPQLFSIMNTHLLHRHEMKHVFLFITKVGQELA
jgi:hypothetical protein